MKKLQSLCYVGMLLAMTLPAYGQDVETSAQPGLAASVRLGTLGYGAELDYPLNSYWNVRVQVNSFNYDDDFNESDIEYKGELDLSTFGALVDLRPFEGTFKLTAGLFSNKNSLSAGASSAADKVFDIGGQRFSGSASNPLALSAQVDLGKSSAGYVGLGWGNSYETGLTFNFELGALLSGTATANLTASGTAFSVTQPQLQFDVQGSSTAAVQFRQELAKEQASLQEDLDDFEVYPVVALGLGYRF